MFDIGGTELLLIAVVALVVIGPKDLPRVLRVVGQYTGKARAMTRHLRSGFDEMMRQAELEEMEKKWADYNRQVMEQTPTVPDYAPPSAVPPVEIEAQSESQPGTQSGTTAEPAEPEPESEGAPAPEPASSAAGDGKTPS